jgi:hypothetical protein
MDPAVMSYHLGRAHNELSQLGPAVMTCHLHGASRNEVSITWTRLSWVTV